MLGGTQSLHTNAKDEALGLPTPESARTALRTQQILAHESGITDAVDPLAGSYYLEHLCDELEREAQAILGQVEALGGSVRAIEVGFIQQEIEEAAYRFQREVEQGTRVVVGVNAFQGGEETVIPVQAVDPGVQLEREREVQAYRQKRNRAASAAALSALREAAGTDTNLFPLVLEAFRSGATLGEVCDELRREWGEYAASG